MTVEVSRRHLRRSSLPDLCVVTGEPTRNTVKFTVGVKDDESSELASESSGCLTDSLVVGGGIALASHLMRKVVAGGLVKVRLPLAKGADENLVRLETSWGHRIDMIGVHPDFADVLPTSK